MVSLLVRNNPDVWAKTSGLLQVSPDIDRISATIPKNSTKRRDYCKIEYLREDKNERSMAKIYVASSWRNQYYPEVVERLREAGHKVYDFRNPPHGQGGFKWQNLDPDFDKWGVAEYREGLKHPASELQFQADLDALEWADTCLLVLPCGRSAHTEAGWMKGSGKRTIVYIPEMQEPELMYKLFDLVSGDFEEVLEFLKDKITQEDIFEAFRYIGVNHADFPLSNSMFTRPVHEPLHGIGHIYRTMIACALLAQRLRMPRAGLIAFCGAYIHDLGRTNDFIDNEHGMNAVNWHFDKYSELWEKYALTDEERVYIKQAVIQHSQKEWTRPGDDGYDVMAILKDADALDRCRIGDLNPAYLRYSESRSLIEIIEDIYWRTSEVNEDITIQEFIEL